MKAIILSAACFILGAGTLFAQHLPCYEFGKEKHTEHQFDVIAYSLREVPTAMYLYSLRQEGQFNKGFHNSILQGVRYRYTSGRSVLRLGISYFNVADKSDFQSGDILLTNSGYYHGLSLMGGYQHNLFRFKKKGMVYVAADYRRTLATIQGIETAENVIDVANPQYF